MASHEKPGVETEVPTAYVEHLIDLIVHGPFNETPQLRNRYRMAAAICLLDAGQAETLAQNMTTVLNREGELLAQREERVAA